MSQIVALAAAVSTAITLAIAFLLFGRRRRRDDSGELELAAAAATPLGDLAPGPAIDPGTGGADIDLPRWRRPSLLAARKSDPVRGDLATAAPARLTFEPGADLVTGERRLIRYRIVRLLDRPDELLGETVGSLDEGDEVAVIEESGLYRRVETPDGRTGWLHKMTLGDTVEAAPEATGGDAIDPDVLMAYLAARGRA
jgi:hypothetical protein